MYYYVNSNELYHHGVLGMKWGIRRYQPYRDGEKKGKEVGEAARAARKFDKKVAKKWTKPLNKASEKFNKELPEINKKYEGKDVSDYSKGAGKEYISEIDATWKKIYSSELKSYFGQRPIDDGEAWIKKAMQYDAFERFK